MLELTEYGQSVVTDLSKRYGVSQDAVLHLLYAVYQGNGMMAQFNHPELGGFGQWMLNGMTMVGDLFNYPLKAKVEGMCRELAISMANAQRPLFVAPAAVEKPAEAATGFQHGLRYDYFPAERRLRVEIDGKLTLYDTGDHQIMGISQQQQNGHLYLMFTSQFGVFAVDSLPVANSSG